MKKLKSNAPRFMTGEEVRRLTGGELAAPPQQLDVAVEKSLKSILQAVNVGRERELRVLDNY